MNPADPEARSGADAPEPRRASPLDDPYEASSLSAPERTAWAALTAVSVVLGAQFEAELHRGAGLTPFEFHLLYVLGVGDAAGEAGGGEMSMSRAAHLVDASLSRLSHVVRRLEARGWVARRPSPEDARVTLVRMTEEGHRRLAAGVPTYESIVQQALTDRLDATDLAELTRLCCIVLGGLKEDHWLFDVGEAWSTSTGALPQGSAAELKRRPGIP